MIHKEGMITYKLNDKTFTAKTTHSPDAKGNIVIPKYINYLNKKYEITAIGEYSFQYRNIKSFSFSPHSNVEIIEKMAFMQSTIESISIPDNFRVFDNLWCYKVLHLINISVSPKNRLFSNYDNKMIIGKTITEGDDYNKLIFVRRDIETIAIPSFIVEIESYAFADCSKLRKIEFEPNSKLFNVSSNAFENTLIKYISFPPSAINFSEDFLCLCQSIHSIEFLGSHFNNEINFEEKPNLFLVSFPNSKNVPILLNGRTNNALFFILPGGNFDVYEKLCEFI